MRILTARHVWSRGTMVATLIGMVCLLNLVANMSLSPTTAHASGPLEIFHENGTTGNYTFNVTKYPTFTRDLSVSNESISDVGLGASNIYKNGKFDGTMTGYVIESSLSYLGQVETQMDIKVVGGSQPGEIKQTLDWFPSYPALTPTPAPGCFLTGNPLKSVFGDVVDAQEGCTDPAVNNQLVGYDHTTNRVIRLPWYGAVAQDFIHGVIAENNNFNALVAQLRNVQTARPLSASTPISPSMLTDAAFQYPVSASTPISPSMLTDAAFQRTNLATRQALVHPAGFPFFAVGIGMLIVGVAMAVGGSVLANWCNGTGDAKCLGEHTATWVRLGGAIATLGGAVFLTGGGLLAGPGIAAMISAQRTAAAATGGVELAAVASSRYATAAAVASDNTADVFAITRTALVA